jgi:hypothetical protein
MPRTEDSPTPAAAGGAEKPWRPLFGTKGFEAFRGPAGAWFHAAEVGLAPGKPKALAAVPADGPVIVNGTGITKDLITTENFGDLEFEGEFLLAKGSNSGVKLHGHYEVQLADSFGKATIDGTDCGGVYPRAEYRPRYRHLDRGTAARVNACLAPGEWQRLRILFRAPRFGPDGKKNSPARLERVELNGKTIHEKLDLASPTGHAWRNQEVAVGPLLLQGDHGPVAFRGVRVRALPPAGA